MERPQIQGIGRAVRSLAFAIGGVMLLAACAYNEPAGNTITQRLTWLSYLDGADIRRACASGAPDRYRLVYNADFNNQARGYDVIPLPTGGAELMVQVDRGFVVDVVQLSEIFEIGAPTRATVALSPAELAELQTLLQESGAFDPPPVGLRLNSRSFYWLVSGCHDGRFFLTGYRFPSDRFDGIVFQPFLLDRDRTGIRLPPATTSTYDREFARCDSRTRQDGRHCFTIQIGEDGLVGVATIN